MALHSSLTGTNAHKAYAWSYATAASRTGASGFVASDIGDLAYQEDTDTLWILTATTPTWQQVDYRALADMFQANAILAADTAQTPASLQIAEERIIGRITGGSITGLTATQVRTLLNLAEQTAMTAQLTTVTCSNPGTPDYAIQDPTTSTPYGFATSDEMLSLIKVVANLQTRVGELETKLQAVDLIATS